MPVALVRWLLAHASFPNLMRGPLPGPAHSHPLWFQLLLKLLQTLSGPPIFFKNKKFDYFQNAFILSFLLCCRAFGILVPRPGIEPTLPEVEAPNLNPWTTRDVPGCRVFTGFTEQASMPLPPLELSLPSVPLQGRREMMVCPLL